MGIVTCSMSISLDGFVAGPNQSKEDPIGQGGMRLHQWLFDTAAWHKRQGSEGGRHTVDSEVVEELFENAGAYIMGRNMFGPGRGGWDPGWAGWWGDEPPYHAPVFVLTHYAREPVGMRGGTTFNFVTGGIDTALQRAKAAAGSGNVGISGGAGTVRQFLAAGMLDELYLHIVPIVLGKGERLLEGVGDPHLEPIKVVASPAVTHVKYRIVRSG